VSLTPGRKVHRAFALVLLCIACGRANAEEPAPPQSLEELRSRIQRELDGANLPGVGIAIVEGGEVVYAGGVGKADLARGTDVTADTRFRAGSITKSLVALAILKLGDDGKLALDQRLADVAPEIAVANPWEATHPVRIANLLEHTAGFDDMHPAELVGPSDLALRDVLAIYPASRKPRWPPGTRMAYASPGYTVAGYLIEKLTGRPYEDFIRDALLVPIGMTGASLRLLPDVQARLAHAYDGEGREVPLVSLLHRPAVNLVASAADLAQLVRFFLHHGKIGDTQIVAEASIERAERGETLPYEGYPQLITQYGLGNRSAPMLGFVAHGHDGNIDGFSSVYAYVKEHDAGWVVLFNSSAGHDARKRVEKLVAGYALRGRAPPSPVKLDLPATALAGFTGDYRLANPHRELFRFRATLLDGLTITLDHGVLYQQGLFARPAALVPVSAGLFRRETEPGPSVLFTRTGDGTPAMIAGEAYLERASPWPARLHLVAIAAALVIALSSIGYAAVWGTRLVASARFRASGHVAVRALPALATLASYGLFLAFRARPQTMLALGTPGPMTIIIFVLSIVYPALTVAALGVTLRACVARPRLNRIAKLHALLAAIANAVLCAYLASWGLLAFRTWAS